MLRGTEGGAFRRDRFNLGTLAPGGPAWIPSPGPSRESVLTSDDSGCGGCGARKGGSLLLREDGAQWWICLDLTLDTTGSRILFLLATGFPRMLLSWTPGPSLASLQEFCATLFRTTSVNKHFTESG